MKKPDLLHDVIFAAFFLCLGAVAANIIAEIADEPVNPCRIADQYRASLDSEIRQCRTEMCVLYFQDRANTAEEECLLGAAEEALKRNPYIHKPTELPVTEKY